MEITTETSTCPPDTLCITPLGGLGEIGLNMMTLECDGSMIVIDAGLMFPEEYMLGIDVVIPDTTYVRNNRDRVRAIVLTHGHEDHIGALPFLLKELHVPVYGTRFTLELVRLKLREVRDMPRCDLREVTPGVPIELGPFSVEYIRVSHSIVDCAGLAVTTPAGVLIHSGDFKIDPGLPETMRTNLRRFAEYGEEGVLALLSDSTNVEREGHTLSERDVERTLDGIFAGCRGRIILTVFASHIRRIQQAVDLSERYGRKVIFNGKSIMANARMAQDLGLLRIPRDVEIDIAHMDRYPDARITVVTTGSQAEPLSAVSRMAMQQHKQIAIREPDTVIFSSSFIPGNERAITRVIDTLYRLGAEVVYETVSDIHASGHAYRDELRTLIRVVRPRSFIPVHGEYRHLVRHARLAVECGLDPAHVVVAENGKQILLCPESTRRGATVPCGRVLVDGKGVGDVDSPVLRDRRRLSEHGMLSFLAVVDAKTGELLAPLEMVSRGVTQENHDSELLEAARRTVLQMISDAGANPPADWPETTEAISRALKRFFLKTVDRRPLIVPVVVPV